MVKNSDVTGSGAAGPCWYTHHLFTLVTKYLRSSLWVGERGRDRTGRDGTVWDGTGFCLKVEEETTHCGRDGRTVMASGDSLHCSHEQEVEEEQEEQEVELGWAASRPTPENYFSTEALAQGLPSAEDQMWGNGRQFSFQPQLVRMRNNVITLQNK